MLRYASWTDYATRSGKHNYRPEERGGSPVEKERAFSRCPRSKSLIVLIPRRECPKSKRPLSDVSGLR
jgi:hypothetical protein